MDDETLELENEISADETTQLEEQPEIDQEVETLQDGDNQPYWQQHENYKKGFWKSEKDAIDGYDFYDKKFKPFSTILNQRGIKDTDSLNDLFSKYDTYSDPNSEINMAYQGMDALQNHPVYGQKFNEFVNQIVEETEIEKYGMKLPNEVKEKLAKIEQFEAREKEREYQQGITSLTEELENSCNKVQDFFKQKGIEITDEELKKHAVTCMNNDIGHKYFYHTFLTENIDRLIGNVQQKAQNAVVSNLNKNKQSSVSSSQRIVAPSSIQVDSSNLKDLLRESLTT